MTNVNPLVPPSLLAKFARKVIEHIKYQVPGKLILTCPNELMASKFKQAILLWLHHNHPDMMLPEPIIRVGVYRERDYGPGVYVQNNFDEDEKESMTKEESKRKELIQ